MLIIGLLLLLLAAAIITYMVLATAGEPAMHLDYGILNLELEPLWLYLSGAATVAVAAIGLALMAAGARSKARKAREVRELRKQAKDQDRRVERSGDATAPRLPRTGSTTRPTTSTGRDTAARPGTTSTSGGPARPGSAPGPRRRASAAAWTSTADRRFPHRRFTREISRRLSHRRDLPAPQPPGGISPAPQPPGRISSATTPAAEARASTDHPVPATSPVARRSTTGPATCPTAASRSDTEHQVTTASLRRATCDATAQASDRPPPPAR